VSDIHGKHLCVASSPKSFLALSKAALSSAETTGAVAEKIAGARAAKLKGVRWGAKNFLEDVAELVDACR